MADKELSFEEALARLEKIVERLEAGKSTLDGALADYEEGVALLRHCNAKLDAAEQRVQAVEKSESGFILADFKGELQ